jgi:hypothetical protein
MKCIRKHPLFQGTVAFIVLGQFSDIPQISENWPRTIRATVPQLMHDMMYTAI